MSPTDMQLVATMLFGFAILHTFSVRYFEHLAVIRPAHAGLWHLLGEVEIVFGFWALVLMLVLFLSKGSATALAYLETRSFTEPLFVFAIMVIAATRPVLQTATACGNLIASRLPLHGSVASFCVVLSVIPLLGSFITEPAAMTLAALMLSERFFAAGVSERFRYTTLGVLFVNVSIGGTLTPFAAPPVLMVATTWDWTIGHMLSQFGWKAALAVFINAAGAAVLLRHELRALPDPVLNRTHRPPVPPMLVATHLAFLIAVVMTAHHPKVFIGLLLFFVGIAQAYSRHQDRLILREGLLVAFFLAGLVVLGGMQDWWLRPLLLSMGQDSVFVGATVLTAFTDNAALTYLGSLVQGLPEAFKYSLVAGAVTGGGLTVIANAPNPAGIAILKGHFTDQAVHPGRLLAAAALPTIIAALAFRLL